MAIGVIVQVGTALSDGQIDFKTIFTKLTEYGCDVWAVMEWECCIKSPEQGAREGAGHC